MGTKYEVDNSGNITANSFDGDGSNITNISTANISGLQTEKWEIFTLDATDVNTNKYVTLVGTVTDNQSIRVFIDDTGIKAEQGIDYSVSGQQIFWTGYEFDGLIAIGEKLNIYFY